VSLSGGIDLGGTKIQTAVLRGKEVAGTGRMLTPQSGAEDVVEAIARTMREATDAAGVKLSDLGGVGLGFPGTIDPDTGVVARAPNLPGFKDHFALGPRLTDALGGLHVTIDNDVRVAVVGEHRAGAGRPFHNLLAVFLGTGVGGGLVLNGELYHGRGNAGEFGHTVVQHGGRLCGCGRRGCLEAYASRGRIEYQARKLVEKGQKTVLFELMEKRNRDRLTSGVIATALEEKDKMTVKLMNDAVKALSVALASTQNLLDLQAIIIGGGLGDRLGQPFIDRVARAMKPHVFVDDNPPKMLTTELGDLSGAVGAALLAQDPI